MIIVAVLAILLLAPQTPQPVTLPGVEAYTRDVWQLVEAFLIAGESFQNKSQPVDGGVLRQYTYTEKETRKKLNSKGHSTEAETNIYQVTRGPEPWQVYRKLISRNGTPLTNQELAKQDREQVRREQHQREEIAREVRQWQKEAAKRKPQPEPAVALTLDQMMEQIDRTKFAYYSSIFRIQIVRREVVDGYDTVLLELKPKPDTKTQDGLLKMLQHIEIRGWVTERDHKLARMEADVIDDISFGFGLLAKFKKGSKLLLEQRPIAQDLWGPVKVDGILDAKILLVKGLHRRETSEYFDFKKYTVETILNVGKPVDQDSR